MLDLDILLGYYNASCRATANRLSTNGAALLPVCEFYTKKLNIESGSAGYLVTDEFLFCGKVISPDGNDVVLVGPVTEHPLSAEAITRIGKSLGLGRRAFAHLEDTLKKMPLVSFSSFRKDLAFLNYLINENDKLPPYNATASREIPAAAIADTEPVFHNTAEFEVRILEYIEFGQPQLLRSALTDAGINRQHMGNVSNDSVQSLKHIFITSTTLACRAAIRGGLDYDRTMALSDIYLQRSERITTYDDFSVLFQEMLIDLSTRAADLQLHKGCSQLIRNTCRLIQANLNRKITAAQLAAELSVSCSYLSHRFKQETGVTLTDYINGQKITEAKRLMRSSHLSMAQIAYQLAFSSQSYFHAVFKRVTGMTPAQFPRK